MRVLLVSHAYASLNNHRKLELLSRYPDLEVGLVVPRVWSSWHGERLSEVGARLKVAYKTYPLPTFSEGDGGKYWYSPLPLGQALRNFSPDIIHLEEEPWTPASFQVAFLNAVFLKKRLVLFSWENLVDLPLNWWRRQVEQYVLKRTCLAIAGNSEAQVRLHRQGFSGPTEVLPQFGVDPSVFKPLEVGQLRRRLGLEGKFVIGFVGRYVEEKGIDTLLQAAQGLGDSVRLLLVSSSPSLPERFIKMAKDLGVYDLVTPASNVLHMEIPQYMNLMSVFVLPSKTTPNWKEQFGRTLIEAMACGVPVIGSSSGAIPEVIGEAGLVFPEGDFRALQGVLDQLRSDKSLVQQLTSLGRAQVTEKYSYERIAARTREIYLSLVTNDKV